MIKTRQSYGPPLAANGEITALRFRPVISSSLLRFKILLFLASFYHLTPKNILGHWVERIKTSSIFYLKTDVMEITGRLTADAVVRKVSGDAKVVGSNVAVNDSYWNGEERKVLTTFFECSYWRNAGVAEYLKKGDVVQVFGRAGVRAYVTKDAEAGAALTFNVSDIKFFGGGSKPLKEDLTAGAVPPKKEKDDLPF